MIGAHVDIANICSLLLFLSGNGGCAGVTERRQLHIFFALCLPACVPYATSGYISVSVSLVYMHSGWYLTQ